MNMFVPQSIQTQMELANIADVKSHVISPRFSATIIKLKQDTVIGSYLMTRENQIIDWHDAMNMIMSTKNVNKKLPKENIKNSKLFSMIIPNKINVKDKKIQIVNGIIQNGMIDGGILNKSIINFCWDKYGAETTKNFIDNSQLLVCNYILYNGFSVGVMDGRLPEDKQEIIMKIVEEKKIEAEHMITEIENNPDLLDPVIAEDQIRDLLATIKGEMGKIVMKEVDKTNNFYIMIGSEAKGSPINIGQIAGSLGQDILKFSRIEKKVNNRSLVHFCQNDDTPESRGFITNSYFNGLSPTEFFFHHMSGREGLIDTAIKSVTGDTELLIMENTIVKHITIGEWIDNLLKLNKDKIQVDDQNNEHREEIRIYDLDINIPTTDLDGKVSWGKITGVTRHKPSNVMYEIITHGGRKVTVTDSHSLLIWNNIRKQFERISPKEIKIGSFVPVTSKLPKPPKMNDYIDFTYLFSQEKFTNEINKSESNLTNKFEFNHHNGLFLGLYIAEGNLNTEKGYVKITNSNTKILNFVKAWFTNHNIKWKINKIGEKSITICGYSVLLTKILVCIAGDRVQNKFIHPQCLSANNHEFLKALVNGIISGRGNITNNSIHIRSSSNRLILDLNNCLNMLNIFGKIRTIKLKVNNLRTTNFTNINVLSIRSQWVYNFKNQIKLICDYKQEKLNKLNPTIIHRNFKEHNDVVLDKIININKIDGSKYQHVYDLTVPSTLNFGLANGLHVVDTADSGYLQRKLIKGLEDIYIAYDSTVRSANNTIIQLFYGDNMLDQEMQKLVKLNLIDMSNTMLIDTYKFTDEELNKLSKNNKSKLEKLKKWNDINLNNMIKYRDDIREISTKSRLDYVTHQYMYFQPANYGRIIEDAKNHVYSKNETLEIDYIIDHINNLLDAKTCQLTCMTNTEYENIKNSTNQNQFSKNYNQLKTKYLFTIALHEYLSPKRCIIEYKLNKEQFDIIIEDIIKSFEKSIVQPGEMVGIVTSQSLGEPLTQLTLNTFHSTGSGVKGMQGIPRFRELLSYTKNPTTPYMTIYLNDNIRKDFNKTNKIAALLNYTILNDMAEKIELIYDIDPYTNSYMKEDDIIDIPFFINNVSDINIKSLPWLARVELNKENLLENNLTLLDIKTRFISFWNNKYSDLSILKKNEKDIVQKIQNCCILSSNDNSIKSYIHLRFDLIEINNDIINGLINIILRKFNIKGNENITKLDIVNDQQTIGYDEDKKIINDTENIMYTVGIDMLTIRDIKGINLNKTLCNDIHTIYTLYGIEAARTMLIYEFTNIFNETKTNYTHINLLVDVMTNNGTIVSIDRHGLNRLETDPLGRVSFEKTIEQLLTAAVFGEKDYLKGVSSRIMVGKCIRGGTGLCDILVDTDIIEKTEVDNTTAYTSEYTAKIKLQSNEILDDIMKRNEFETIMPFN